MHATALAPKDSCSTHEKEKYADWNATNDSLGHLNTTVPTGLFQDENQSHNAYRLDLCLTSNTAKHWQSEYQTDKKLLSFISFLCLFIEVLELIYGAWKGQVCTVDLYITSESWYDADLDENSHKMEVGL